MRISASRTDREAGYSLLEVIVVVAIIATAMAISVPSLGRMVERHQVRTVMKSIDRSLIELRLDSFTQTQHVSATEIDAYLQQDLPAGWSVTASEELSFSGQGYCSGGDLTVIIPGDRTYSFNLEPGHCEISAQIG